MPHQDVQSVKIGAMELEHRHTRETGQYACRQARRDRVEGPAAAQPPPPEERRRSGVQLGLGWRDGLQRRGDQRLTRNCGPRVWPGGRAGTLLPGHCVALGIPNGTLVLACRCAQARRYGVSPVRGA